MYRLQLADKTKQADFVTYYMEEKEKLQDYWCRSEQYAEGAAYTEVELKIGAKQDFTMENCHLVIHNTKGQECRYYAEHLLVKVRFAKAEEGYLKLASFVANGIAKKNEYEEGGYEQVVCCGNPVLDHYASPITPLVSDFAPLSLFFFGFVSFESQNARLISNIAPNI